jgi:hypothetical protein
MNPNIFQPLPVLGNDEIRDPAQRPWAAIIQPPNRTAPIGVVHTATGADTPIGRQATSMEAVLGRKATKASGLPLRKATQGVINRTPVDTRALRAPTRRNRAVTLAVTAAGRAASVAAEATASVAVVAIAPAADTEALLDIGGGRARISTSLTQTRNVLEFKCTKTDELQKSKIPDETLPKLERIASGRMSSASSSARTTEPIWT